MAQNKNIHPYISTKINHIAIYKTIISFILPEFVQLYFLFIANKVKKFIISFVSNAPLLYLCAQTKKLSQNGTTAYTF